jgi:hypothetical protein
VFIATLKALANAFSVRDRFDEPNPGLKQPWEPVVFIATLKALANAFSVRDRFGRSQPRVGGNTGNRVRLLQR